MLLRRAGGLSAAAAAGWSCFRRGLATEDASRSRPDWAMVFEAPLVLSPSPRPAFQLLDPPTASRILVPVHLVDPRPGAGPRTDYSDAADRFIGGAVHATSGDGLLLLDFADLRGMDRLDALRAGGRALRLNADLGPHEFDILTFVCNPLSGEMLRLPDAGGTKKVLDWHSHGIITHSALGHGPPDRYAVAEMRVELGRNAEAELVTVRRFLSQTGKWDKLVYSGSGIPLPPGRWLNTRTTPIHEVVAFAGRLWYVDVSFGALSFDPLSDRPEIGYLELPRGSVMDKVEMQPGLGRYRRVGVSEGKLRYAEVTREEPFVLSSFVLDNDSGSGSWTLVHRMSLSRLHPKLKEAPRIAVVDPLNASVIHIIVNHFAYAIDMDKEEVLGCSASPVDDSDGDPLDFQPCVLPPWLGSSPIPSSGAHSSGKANVKSNTLSDILVRADSSKKN